jgi:CheY-like chemotaxis protein
MKTEKDQKIALIVDDDTEFLDMISDTLTHPRFEIRSSFARDGYEAVEQIVKAKPDILFIDFALPRANAGEILPKLKAVPELSGMPVYFITGYPTQEIFPFLRGLDFDGILVKGSTMASEILNILDQNNP